MFYSADNAKLLIDGNEILASAAQISLGANVNPNYLITQRHTNEYVADGGIGGQLSFTYHLTGADYFKSFITGQGETGIERPIDEIYTDPISGNFGGLYFESGYLTSYSVTFSPNAPAAANATVNFFDYARGSFASNSSVAPTDTQILNFSEATVAGEFATGSVDNFIAGTYNYSAEVQPVYLMGETRPSNVSFGPKTVNMNFEVDSPTGYLPFSGSRSKITVDLKNSAGTTVDSFMCSGVMNSRNLASAVGDYIKQTINVTQSNVINEFQVEGFIGAGQVSALNPNKKFIIKGKNMMFSESVSFGAEEVSDLSYMGTTGISGLVPAGAFTNDVVVQGVDSSEFAGRPFIVLTSDDQVKVGPLNVVTSVSGYAGNEISITGENFYQIDTVNFGNTPTSPSAKFSVMNEKEIRSVVPQNSPWEGVTVFSSSRTGVNGSISEASGISTNKFVIFPEVRSLNTPQLVSGAQAEIIGTSFGAVTGVKFNDKNLVSVSVPNNYTVNGIVPSGDTWGSIKFELRSGITHAADTSFQFKSLARITGVGPVLGIGTAYPAPQTVGGVVAYLETGSVAAISGENFTSDILYSAAEAAVGQNGYIVSFSEDRGVTGAFDIVSTGVMTGRIPSNIPTGTSAINIYSHHYPETYPSDVDFTLKYSAPNITSLSPASGVAGETNFNIITINGENLYSITGVDFTGAAGHVGIGTMAQGTAIQGTVDGASVTVELADSMSSTTSSAFFDVVVSGKYGTDTKKSGFFQYGQPTVTSIDPTGFISPGQTGLVVGTNLYPNNYTKITLVKDSIANSVATIDASGFVDDGVAANYATNFTQFNFTYPQGFETGLYKSRVKNIRSKGAGVLYNKLLGPYTLPVISGFSPTSVDDTTSNITVSGAFAAVTGGALGGFVVSDFTAHQRPIIPNTSIPDVTGITFTLKEGMESSPIEVRTSGGDIYSSRVLDITPPAPDVSGFWIGKEGDKPSVIDYADQVFTEANLMTISGSRFDIVTGVEFSGATDKFSVSDSTFVIRDYNTITMEVPLNLNTGSGIFNLLDYKNRSSACNAKIDNSGINIFNFSGINDYAQAAGEKMTLSGVNISGTSVLFSGDRGQGVISVPTYSPVMLGGVQVVNAQFPTGVQVRSNFMITGRGNDSLYESQSLIRPLSTISGFSGYGAGTISTGAKNLVITGVNYYTPSQPLSGSYVVAISGTGYNGIQYKDTNNTGICLNYFPITGYKTGLGANNSTICDLQVEVTNPDVTRAGFFPVVFVGTGQLFLYDAWANVGGDQNTQAREFLDTMVTSTYTYNMVKRKTAVYSNELIVQGTPAKITGYGPTLGITGTTISLTGEGLSLATGVTFYNAGRENSYDNLLQNGYSVPPGGIRTPVASNKIQRISDNKITVEVPRMAISSPTENDIWIFGGTCCTGGTFTVLPEAKGYVEDIISDLENTEGEAPRALPGKVVRFSVDEFINGVRYIVTYDKYPDGTLVKISTVSTGGASP